MTVPTQALSGSTVTVVMGSKRTTTRVETGLEGDDSTQILSGLKAGDQVAVTSTSATAGAAASQGNGASGGQGAGGGGLGGAGGGRFPGGGGAGLGGGGGPPPGAGGGGPP